MPQRGVCLVYVRNSKETSESYIEWTMEKGVTDVVTEIMEMMVNVDLCRLLPIVSWMRKKLILKKLINQEDIIKIHIRKYWWIRPDDSSQITGN